MPKSKVTEEQLNLFFENMSEETREVLLKRAVGQFITSLMRKEELIGELTDEMLVKAAQDYAVFNLRKAGGGVKVKEALSVKDCDIIGRFFIQKAMSGEIPEEEFLLRRNEAIELIRNEIEESGISAYYNEIRVEMGIKPKVLEEETQETQE